MKKVLIFIGIAAMLYSCVQTSTTSNEVSDETEGVFIHITKDHADPHRVLMPLQMAEIMSEDKDVLIYLDIDAVKLVTKDAEDVTFEHFTPLKEAITALLEKGVEIHACPGCMKVAGIEESDLMEGVKVAEKDRFFNFTEGHIVSLSY